MKIIGVMIVALLPVGCATFSLEQYTLREIRTIEDFRVKATLDCLATTAANADNLPAFGLLLNGTAKIQDMETLNSITLWTRAIHGFASETLTGSLSRQPQGTWSIEPVGDFSKLAAVRCACVWVLFGPEAAVREFGNLLDDPGLNYSPLEPQFGVVDRLRRLRHGWVHMGRRHEIPPCVKYKAHCKGVWVWVLPEDACCLSEFILVLHDIATIDVSALYSPPLLVTITRNIRTLLDSQAPSGAGPQGLDQTKLNPLIPAKPGTQEKGTTFQITEYRVIRREKRAEIEAKIKEAMRQGKTVNISLAEWMADTYAYNGTRSNAKAASGLQVSNAVALQQQNLVPPSRNPAFSGQFLGTSQPTPQEIARLRSLLATQPSGTPKP